MYAIFCSSALILFLIIHIKFACIFYLSQIIDLFAYETPYFNQYLDIYGGVVWQLIWLNIIVYIFYITNFNYKFIIFSSSNTFNKKFKNGVNIFFNAISSITKYFLGSFWIEREMRELSGIWFLNLLDSRNLLLCYGCNFFPLEKNYNISILDMIRNMVRQGYFH